LTRCCACCCTARRTGRRDAEERGERRALSFFNFHTISDQRKQSVSYPPRSSNGNAARIGLILDVARPEELRVSMAWRTLPRERSSWKPEHVSSWFETLGEQGTIADALAKELGAVALRLKLDGPTLRCMDTEGWAALGITDAIQRSACRAAFEQADRLPTVGSNSAHLSGEIKVGFKINVLSISALYATGLEPA